MGTSTRLGAAADRVVGRALAVIVAEIKWAVSGLRSVLLARRLPDLAERVAYFTAYKFAPCPAEIDVLAEWDRCRHVLSEVYRHCLASFIGRPLPDSWVPTAELTLTMVLPTYNERDNIGPLIDALLRHLGAAAVLVVDDDSPDGTWLLVADMAQRDARVHLLRRIDRRGLTSAIADGVAAARTDAVGWMDCDFSMPPEHVPALLAALETADIAIGSRYRDGGQDRRDARPAVVLSRIINAFAGLVLGRAIGDYTTGFVVAKKPVVEQIGLRGDYGEYCIDFLHRARRAGYRIREVGYVCIPREHGTSKTGTNLCQFARRGIKYVLTVLRLRLGFGS